jgi:hypothetical protein
MRAIAVIDGNQVNIPEPAGCDGKRKVVNSYWIEFAV